MERFISTASDDPQVVAIKMTLYRTGENSPIVNSLIRAAEKGKHVVCLVELRARLDEERNIYWAQRLEDSGVHVVYGVEGLKTHSKVCLVVRKEKNTVRPYVHIGTGNYNKTTAALYTDLGLFTVDTDITDDVIELFHFLTGRSLKSEYKKLLIAPVNMKAKFIQLIEQEVKNLKKGKPAGIICKMNQIQDKEIIKALYMASIAGVPIQLNIRGFSCLIPGVKEQSETIKVTSIIGRFLEHSRIFYFRNGKDAPEDGHFLMGSADWMSRNLNRRVEAIVPVESKEIKKRLWTLLQTTMKDNSLSWDMQADGSYKQKKKKAGEPKINLHQSLCSQVKSRNLKFEEEN